MVRDAKEEERCIVANENHKNSMNWIMIQGGKLDAEKISKRIFNAEISAVDEG